MKRLVHDSTLRCCVHPVHGLLHLLDPSLVAPSHLLQSSAQATPPMEGADAIRKPCVPPSRRVSPERALPPLCLSLSNAQVHLSFSVRRCQYLDGIDSRWRFPRSRDPEATHQWLCPPH